VSAASGRADEDDPLGRALAGADGVWAREHLDVDIVGWLTTVSADGRPQSAVVSFLLEGGTILIYSQADTPKLRNLERSPLVSFHLQSDAYADHLLVIEGTAEIDSSTPPSDEHPAYRAKYAEPLAHWQMDASETARSFSVPIRIRPIRVRVA
jgi:PPOX class probable F420-dependent enzyme